MHLPNPIARIRIGTKLGICMGFGGLLVAGMIINEQISSNTIRLLTEVADLQHAIVSKSIQTESVLQSAQIASRDLRMARKLVDVEKILGELQQIRVDGDRQLSALEAQTAIPANRERFKSISELFQRYLAALGDIGENQTKILSLFGDLDQIELKWTRRVLQVVNSSPVANLPNHA